MHDGRGTYSKIRELHKMLVEDYVTYEEGKKPSSAELHYKDIEYYIRTNIGFADRRTYKKFFTLMEEDHFLLCMAKGGPVRPHATVTKQKGSHVTLHHYRGEKYCWSHYKLGRIPVKIHPSPHTPPQRRFGDIVEVEAAVERENMCVRVPEREANHTLLITMKNVVASSKRKNIEEEGLARTHISSNKMNLVLHKPQTTSINMETRYFLQQMKNARVKNSGK